MLGEQEVCSQSGVQAQLQRERAPVGCTDKRQRDSASPMPAARSAPSAPTAHAPASGVQEVASCHSGRRRAHQEDRARTSCSAAKPAPPAPRCCTASTPWGCAGGQPARLATRRGLRYGPHRQGESSVSLQAAKRVAPRRRRRQRAVVPVVWEQAQGEYSAGGWAGDVGWVMLVQELRTPGANVSATTGSLCSQSGNDSIVSCSTASSRTTPLA